MRDTKTALLDAARVRLSEHGFGGTSIRDLAGAVGIKESSVYNHFPSKQALLDAVLEDAERCLAAVAERLGTPIGDPDEASDLYETIEPAALETMANGFLDMYLQDEAFVAARRVLTLEQYRNPAAGDRLRDLMIDRPLTFQSAVFAQLMERGAFRPSDPDAVALAFWGPILAIATIAESDEAGARQRLASHLRHFTDTHVSGEEKP